MQQREIVHNYINALTKYLARLDKADAQEVIREIESHIYDAIELQEENGETVDAQAVLTGFGKPRQLALQYSEHILAGTPPPRGFKAIQTVKKGVTGSLYYAMAAFGFSVAAALMMLAVAKLFAPDVVGVWSAANGDSFTISYAKNAYPVEQELLGYWLVPLGMVVAISIGELTRRVLRVLKSSM